MSQAPLPESDPPRNPETFAVHRRESIWQIWVPIGLALVVVTLLVILIWLSQHGTISQWGAVALILLIIPILIVGLILLVLNVGSVILVSQAYSKISPYMLQGQIFLKRVERGAFQYADALTEPFIRLKVFWARLMGVSGKKSDTQ